METNWVETYKLGIEHERVKVENHDTRSQGSIQKEG